MWFVEFEGSKGWEVSKQTESHNEAVNHFNHLLVDLQAAIMLGVESGFVAVRIEFRR